MHTDCRYDAIPTVETLAGQSGIEGHADGLGLQAAMR
jgi:hypothetical protein